jgi:dihydrodipicolinate synthase/N-acetylneuraminate lyase
LEFAKATLHHEFVAVERTSRQLQSLIRRARAEDELSVADLAIYSGLDQAIIEGVLMGTPLVDLLLVARK